ncbi:MULTISPECIES: acyltransferase family protein [Thermomonosporaceae]|uniref:acyltransferase family protein n=1 Tax=Thermomonosporaceae TaxID=2012 RepID=UPI00255AE98A|nr:MULTISPECIES: acyltransferase family protein [Thermomonosporaceae]MDL4776054.1 acyltransferase family protein [Actinomadura xylanilytica]
MTYSSRPPAAPQPRRPWSPDPGQDQDPASGPPPAGTPAPGTPALGTSPFGTPALGTPALGTPDLHIPAPHAPAPRAPEPPGAPPVGPPGAGAPAPGPPVAGTPPKPRKERDPFFDNAKFLAILLVVMGHSLANLLNVPLARGLYLFIYMFHMPLFIVVTGYFSRNWTFSGGKARKLITNVGVPYVVFEIAYSLYDWLAGRNELEISLLNPYFLTWFLCALFMWRLSTPVWQQIRWPLAVSLVFSLLSYMSDLGGTFDVHRVIGLLPFYVLGLMLKPDHFELLKKPVARALGALVLLGGFGAAWVAKDRMSRDWIYWKSPHEDLGVGNVVGTGMRLAMFACAVVLVAAFLTQVPRRRTWFTGLGATTLYAYLLHGFVTRLLQFTGWWGSAWMHTVPGVLIVMVGAIVVGTLLCSKPVVTVMGWALEPKMTFAFTGLRRPQRNVTAKRPPKTRPRPPRDGGGGEGDGAEQAPPVGAHRA